MASGRPGDPHPSGRRRRLLLLLIRHPLGIAGCDNNNGYAFSDVGAVANRNLALLMMAYSSGKPISVHLTGSCMPNGGGRPMVDTVEITEVGYY